MRIYLAGPLFTTAERQFNTELAAGLRAWGHEVWVPQDNEPRHKTAENIFLNDKAGIDWCEAVVANMDGPDPDSGTCWECGYAYAIDKRIVVFRADFRGIADSDDASFNLMLSASADSVLQADGMTIVELAKKIATALQVLA